MSSIFQQKKSNLKYLHSTHPSMDLVEQQKLEKKMKLRCLVHDALSLLRQHKKLFCLIESRNMWNPKSKKLNANGPTKAIELWNKAKWFILSKHNFAKTIFYVGKTRKKIVSEAFIHASFQLSPSLLIMSYHCYKKVLNLLIWPFSNLYNPLSVFAEMLGIKLWQVHLLNPLQGIVKRRRYQVTLFKLNLRKFQIKVPFNFFIINYFQKNAKKKSFIVQFM